MNALTKLLTDRNVFARLSRRRPALTSSTRYTVPVTGRVAAVDPPADDNFYFETSIASPAVQLSVWELINDEHEPSDAVPGEDERDEGVLASGHTATVAFWSGERGQALLRAFDDGPEMTCLGSWLASTFPNLYGPDGQALAGKTNTEVADLFRTLARAAEPRLEAQILALALAIYATREFLGGPAGEAFGFRVSPLGVSPCICNIGPLGAPFRAANGSSLTVLHLLNTLDAQVTHGTPLAGNDILRQQAHDLLDLINQFGGIDG